MRKRRFTLVEIMIVVAIIGLLAAIAVPNFVRSRKAARQKTCIENLRAIDFAKQNYAMENNVKVSVEPAEGNLTPYLKGNMPNCPAGGTYTIGNIETDPSCTLSTQDPYPHKLP